jgi:hypothetical protein
MKSFILGVVSSDLFQTKRVEEEATDSVASAEHSDRRQ